MITRLPASAIYTLFALGFLAATAPVWRFWLFGFNPTLDDLLQLRCFGL